ncbi:MAG: hypothetical protein KDK70_28805 [Myxococcales bacterium]|nr:hypothetical protein [Myxococcales bacterium]
MQRRVVVGVALALAMGCSHPNPKYDENDSTGGTTQADSEGTTAVTVADASTGSPDATSSADTTGSPESTGESCELEVMQRVPLQDTFLMTATDRTMCDGLPCQLVDFGGLLDAVVQDGGPLRSHFLMTFQVPSLQMLDFTGAHVVLGVEPPRGDLMLQVRRVFPVDWVEGEGEGHTTAMGTATWQAAAEAPGWTTISGMTGPYDVVINDGNMIISPQPGANASEIDIVLPPMIFGDIVPGSIVHLDVTVLNQEVRVYSRKSDAPPRLFFRGC